MEELLARPQQLGLGDLELQLDAHRAVFFHQRRGALAYLAELHHDQALCFLGGLGAGGADGAVSVRGGGADMFAFVGNERRNLGCIGV